jgi:hypothetical protein
VSCISILKLDTEGCEVPILTALQNYLPQTEVIYLEYHSEFDRRRIDSMLDRTHVLFHAAVFEPHRGTIGYIAADVLDKLHRASSRPRYAFPKTRT